MTFSKQPESRWEFITDQVMGGVSTGQVKFEAVDGRMAAHLTGQVSTEKPGVASSSFAASLTLL